jgi:hypothetical protein
MIAIQNGISMEELNDWLADTSLELLRTSPDMPSAKIRPLRSTIYEDAMVNSNTQRGNKPQTSKGVKTMENKIKSEIRIEWEQMGCMPCDMGITGEMIINECDQKVYLAVSFTPEGDFYTVNNASIFDDENEFAANIIEEYDDIHQIVKSKYFAELMEIDEQLNVEIAKRNQTLKTNY